MKGLRVEKRVHIKANLTWEDWNLYKVPGCATVAAMMNGYMERLINLDCVDKPTFIRKMTDMMMGYEGYGTDDTERFVVLYTIANTIFPE